MRGGDNVLSLSWACLHKERCFCITNPDAGIKIFQAEFPIGEGECFDVGELLNAIGRTVTVIGEVVEVIAVSSGAFGDGVVGGITGELGNVLAGAAV